MWKKKYNNRIRKTEDNIKIKEKYTLKELKKKQQYINKTVIKTFETQGKILCLEKEKSHMNKNKR